MGWRPAWQPLQVVLNNRPVGTLSRESNSATRFVYHPDRLAWEHASGFSFFAPARDTLARRSRPCIFREPSARFRPDPPACRRKAWRARHGCLRPPIGDRPRLRGGFAGHRRRGCSSRQHRPAAFPLSPVRQRASFPRAFPPPLSRAFPPPQYGAAAAFWRSGRQ